MSRPTLLLALAGQSAARIALADEGEVIVAATPAESLAAMRDNDVAAALVGAGPEAGPLLAALKADWPDTGRLLLGAAEGEADLALPDGAGAAALRLAVRSACRQFRLARENARLATEAKLRAPRGARPQEPQAPGLAFARILHTPGSPMAAVIAQAQRLASFDVPVLLIGEPATGKADLARAIHDTSLRADRPFHATNLAGLSEAQVELELFGARAGAVPGLAASRAGLVQKAERGTLFLDGVETLGPRMQQALLRLVRDGLCQPIGAAEPMTAAPRLLTGAHTDPATLRPDLYYALAVTELQVPPLRERPGDIPALAREILAEAAQAHGKPVRGLTEAACAFLAGWHWPGNLRELENELTRMLIAAQEPVLGAELVSRPILQAGPAPQAGREADMVAGGPLKDRLERIEARILHETCTRLKWNKSRAAAELGLSRVGLRAKLDRYGLAPPMAEAAE